MNVKLQKPKGTYDLYGDDGKLQLYLYDVYRFVMDLYNCEFVRTPLFETTDLFHRGVGDETDIVSKETYTFLDRGNRSITLRPEGTASVVRSYIENKLFGRVNQPVKQWYYGTMYRYERPQAGRFREFSQFGLEVLGVSSAIADVEVISIVDRFFKELGIKNYRVLLNSIGDIESRDSYKKELVKYFNLYLDDLCDDCKKRLVKNPLRVLDCKIDNNKDFFKSAPIINDYLNVDSLKHFDMVKKYLDKTSINYVIDNNLVRGLDYYSHTVFEFEYLGNDVSGSHDILGGGGRYDGLASLLGGPETNGVGFALGAERLLEIIKQNSEVNNDVDFYVFNNSSKDELFVITDMLRENDLIVESDYLNRSYKSNFNQALRVFANCVLIIEDDGYIVKDLTTKTEVLYNDITELKRFIGDL